MSSQIPLTDPSSVSLAHSYPAMEGSPQTRSRNGSHNKTLDNNLTIGLGNTPSRVSLGSVLAQQPSMVGSSATMNTQLNHENLKQQKHQMQKNNEDLFRYMEFRKELEKSIKHLEKENDNLRSDHQQGASNGAIVPDFKPRDHAKQKIISALHAEIVRSQRNYDEKEANIEKLASDQETLQQDTKSLIEKATILKREKHNYDESAKKALVQIPEAMQNRDRIRDEIAEQEAEFRKEYKALQEELAKVKPIEVPTMVDQDKFNAPNIAKLKDQMQKIREQIKKMANNIEKEQELAHIRNQKENLQKQCDQLLKQTNILEHQLSKITENCIEERQKTNSKAAEVDSLESSLNIEKKEHDEKLDYLNELYRELYDQWNKLMHDIQDQKRKQREHESIKEELELMKKLLGMNSFTGGSN